MHNTLQGQSGFAGKEGGAGIGGGGLPVGGGASQSQSGSLDIGGVKHCSSAQTKNLATPLLGTPLTMHTMSLQEIEHKLCNQLTHPYFTPVQYLTEGIYCKVKMRN